MRTTSCVIAIMLATCPLLSCSDSANQQARMAEPPAPARPVAAPPKIETTVKTRQELLEQITSHAGKVVVVDLWALW